MAVKRRKSKVSNKKKRSKVNNLILKKSDIIDVIKILFLFLIRDQFFTKDETKYDINIIQDDILSNLNYELINGILRNSSINLNKKLSQVASIIFSIIYRILFNVKDNKDFIIKFIIVLLMKKFLTKFKLRKEIDTMTYQIKMSLLSETLAGLVKHMLDIDIMYTRPVIALALRTTDKFM